MLGQPGQVVHLEVYPGQAILSHSHANCFPKNRGGSFECLALSCFDYSLSASVSGEAMDLHSLTLLQSLGCSTCLLSSYYMPGTV